MLEFAGSFQAEGEYRVAFAVDESSTSFDVGSFDKISLSRERFARLGLLDDVEDIFWRAGDYVFYCAREQYPNTSWFWMIEYDVAINRLDPLSFLREVDRLSAHDLLSAHYREPEGWWNYAEALRPIYPKVMRCFYPLIRLSAKAVTYAYKERARHSAIQRAIPKGERLTWPNDEGFTATSLTDGGFACADLLQIGPYYTKETFWFGPMRHPVHLPPADGKIYHPVRSGWAYLHAARQGITLEPPLDPATLLALYPDLSDHQLAETFKAIIEQALIGAPDDPQRVFSTHAVPRLLLKASPTSAAMAAVVEALVSSRRSLCLTWLRRARAAEGWPHVAALDNLALGMPADQSSWSPWSAKEDCRSDARGGNNGRLDVDFGFHTAFELQPNWTVDLTCMSYVVGVRIHNRVQHRERLQRFEIWVSRDGLAWETIYWSSEDVQASIQTFDIHLNVRTRYVRIQLPTHTALHLREIEVFGTVL